jgi:hypothetical protein
VAGIEVIGRSTHTFGRTLIEHPTAGSVTTGAAEAVGNIEAPARETNATVTANAEVILRIISTPRALAVGHSSQPSEHLDVFRGSLQS